MIWGNILRSSSISHSQSQGISSLFPGLNNQSSTKITLRLPSLLGEWILRAVPKKKPSYRRTRQKLYAPGNKKIQPLENIVRCPACGSVKRSHFMCMNCFMEIRTFLKRFKPKSVESEQIVDEIDEKILYPGKRLTDHDRRVQQKDWIPQREKPLAYNPSQIKHKK